MILHAVQTFVGTPEDVFPFFADAHNLERITPGNMSFRILSGRPIEMRNGATTDYALRVNGFPIRWRSEILNWHPNQRFTDQQLKGPYKKWVHEHRFIARGANTEVHDRVDYEVPGPAFVERWLVRQQLRQIFEYRQRALGWIFQEAAPARLHIGGSDVEIASEALQNRGAA